MHASIRKKEKSNLYPIFSALIFMSFLFKEIGPHVFDLIKPNPLCVHPFECMPRFIVHGSGFYGLRSHAKGIVLNLIWVVYFK